MKHLVVKRARISKFHEFVLMFFVIYDFMIFCRLFDMSTPKARDIPDEDSLSLYAVFNVWEAPRKLSRSSR